VINRRITGSAPLVTLENNPKQGPLKNSWQQTLFSLDNWQPYQSLFENYLVCFSSRRQRNLTAGIPGVFRGLNSSANKEIGKNKQFSNRF
jgi:hypothetical protein